MTKLKATAVRSPRGARTTEIDFSDGHKGIYPHSILRGYCPCAGCQGHTGSIKFLVVEEGPALEVDVIEAVGNYALRFEWFDQHGSGIYSYAYLRALCCCKECHKDGEHREMPRM